MVRKIWAVQIFNIKLLFWILDTQTQKHTHKGIYSDKFFFFVIKVKGQNQRDLVVSVWCTIFTRGTASLNLFVCSVVLRFYGPVNRMGSCRVKTVYLTTLLLDRLNPLLNSIVHILLPETDKLPSLNQRKGKNDCRKYFMINLHKRIYPVGLNSTGNLFRPYSTRDISGISSFCNIGQMSTYRSHIHMLWNKTIQEMYTCTKFCDSRQKSAGNLYKRCFSNIYQNKM